MLFKKLKTTSQNILTRKQHTNNVNENRVLTLYAGGTCQGDAHTCEYDNKDDIKDTHDRVAEMEKLITHLKDKTDNLGNCSRRSNIG